jgi:hypothetical protein
MDASQSRGASLEEDMPHYKSLFDEKDFLFAFDLDGRDVTVTIERCTGGEITGENGRKSKKPMLSFVGKRKKLALNKTNGATIAALYGVRTEAWAGKSITLYPTTTTFGKDTVECVRIRPVVPKERPAGKGKPAPQESAPAESDEPAHDETTGEVTE